MATIDLMDRFGNLGEGGIRNNGTLDDEVLFQTSLRTMRTDFIQVKAGDSIIYKNMNGMSSIWNILSFYTGDAQGYYVSGISGQTTPQSGVWTATQDGYVRLFGSFPAGDNISVTMTDLAPDVEDYLAKYNAMNYRFLPNSIPKIVAHIQEYLSNHPIADSTTLQAVIDAAFKSYLEEIQETADTYIAEAVPPAAAAAVDAAASPALEEINAKAAEAAESARQAGLSQQSAEMSEENALTYRNQAQQIKDSITAEVAASVQAAQEQATLAQESAQAADQSADTAEQYVAQARAQAAAAAAQAQTASGYASDAQGYMQDASGYAQNAAQSAATFTTDPTLTISGKAADAKATGDQLSDLKSALFGGTKSLHVTDIQVGYYANNSYNSSNAFRWGYVDCSSVMGYIGTVTVTVDLTNISDSANIEVLNSSKTFVRKVSNWATGTRTVTLGSPEQYLRISARTDDISKIVVIGTIPVSINSRIGSIESKINAFALETDLYSNSTTRELEDIVQNAYFDYDGVKTNSAFLYGFVDIKNATKIVVDQSNIVDTSLLCFADANRTYILGWARWAEAGIRTTVSIPANACYLVYSCKKSDYGKQTFTIYRNGIQTQIDNTVEDSTKYDGAYAYVRTIDHKFIKGLHLDCGRKYFSVANIKLLLDQMEASGLNTFQIYFSDNNGFRFGLDDMEVVVDGITYDISVCLGDGVAPTDGSNKWLTQADMNEIISYANGKGIEVIPAFDMPGHMGAIRLDFPAVNEAYSPLTVPGRKFMITLLTKYVDYFASKGCKFFNICGDESSLTSAQWETFMLEACKAIVQHNMTPMMYNDKVCCDGYFDPFIAVGAYVLCWARRGNMASFTTLENCGYKIMNCKGNGYYWVLGTTETTQALIDAISASNIYQMTDSSVMPTICGAMYHIWCDQADADGADDGDNVVAQTLPCIAAFGTAVNNKVPEDYKPNNNTIQTYENLESLGNGKGLILRSANGTAYKITVGNDGTISSTAM